MLLHPVPAQNKINISYYSGKASPITISVIDATGRVILKQKEFIAMGYVTIPINIEQLAKGNFTLMVDDGEKILREPFMKL